MLVESAISRLLGGLSKRSGQMAQEQSKETVTLSKILFPPKEINCMQILTEHTNSDLFSDYVIGFLRLEKYISPCSGRCVCVGSSN